MEELVQEEMETPPETPDPAIENRARIQGWVPKEDFRGDPSLWRPADEFVRRADEMMPILKSVNRKLESQVGTLTKKLTDTQGMIEKMVKVQSKYSEDSYNTAIADIKTQKLKAVEDGNIDMYQRLEAREALISKPESVHVDPKPNENHMESMHPDVQQWVNDNSTWFGKDPELTDYAVYLGEQLKNSKDPSAMPGNEAQFCQKVKERVQKTFPHKFANPNQNITTIDESSTRGVTPPSKTGKTWNDLPQDARQHCSRLLQEIPGYTKEKYLKDYFEG